MTSIYPLKERSQSNYDRSIAAIISASTFTKEKPFYIESYYDRVRLTYSRKVSTQTQQRRLFLIKPIVDDNHFNFYFLQISGLL